jgi:hypothetical protein
LLQSGAALPRRNIAGRYAAGDDVALATWSNKTSVKFMRSRPICAIRTVAHALRDAAAAVNLVGVLQQSGAQRFDAIQHHGAQIVACPAGDAATVGLRW